MRNRYPGKCSLCGKHVPVGEGRWKLTSKPSQNFTGLRCLACGTTTKGHKEHFEKVLGKKLTHKQYKYGDY